MPSPSFITEGGAKLTVKAEDIVSARKQRKPTYDPGQTCITDYFNLLNEIEMLAKENAKLSKLLQQNDNRSFNTGGLNPILRQILINAEKNAFIYPSQRRHTEILKKFSTALFIYCGPLAYDFLHQNMSQGLPSLRTVQRIIHAQYKTLHEGVFRFDELLAHITDHNAPKIVSIGEDATRVIGRVDYDSETNRCVGFVLPLDVNGLPVVDAYLATSFTAIEAMFNSASISKYAYTYMAQPLASNIPPLCLACLGSDQKFTAQHVLQRWQYIYSQCAERGIRVATSQFWRRWRLQDNEGHESVSITFNIFR